MTLMQAKKSLGQNFLKNDTIIKKIVSLFVCGEKDLILEIGPGRGALTKYLQDKGRLVCIEIDKDMKPYLDNLKCDVVYDDILQIDLKSLLSKYDYENLYIIGNLPYYITSPIIQKLLLENIKAEKMIFMVQKEVAERFSAKPGHKDYGYMTVFINHFYDAQYEFLVPKMEFIPVPKVDSAIITLNKKDYEEVSDAFWDFLKECFSHKRKTLKNNLSGYDYSKILDILKKYGYKENARAEEISEEVFKEIHKAIRNGCLK